MDEVQGLLVVNVVAGVADIPGHDQEEERELLRDRHRNVFRDPGTWRPPFFLTKIFRFCPHLHGIFWYAPDADDASAA
jgi:hypothetical protein